VEAEYWRDDVKWGKPLSVTNRQQWRAWLETNHESAREAFILHFKASSRAGDFRYEDAVEEALCFGWVDGVERRYDDDRMLSRFSPRRPKSNWSQSNRSRMRRLIAAGVATPAGMAALPPDFQFAGE
jgi:uncharacterized protein YdeI (YjbR/CyaY-like superfamily)